MGHCMRYFFSAMISVDNISDLSSIVFTLSPFQDLYGTWTLTRVSPSWTRCTWRCPPSSRRGGTRRARRLSSRRSICRGRSSMCRALVIMRQCSLYPRGIPLVIVTLDPPTHTPSHAQDSWVTLRAAVSWMSSTRAIEVIITMINITIITVMVWTRGQGTVARAPLSLSSLTPPNCLLMRELSQGAGRDTLLLPLITTPSTAPRSLRAPPPPRHYPPQLMCQQGNYSEEIVSCHLTSPNLRIIQNTAAYLFVIYKY